MDWPSLVNALGPRLAVIIVGLIVLWVTLMLWGLIYLLIKFIRSGTVRYNGHGLSVNSLDLVERRLRFAHAYILGAKTHFCAGLDEISMLKLDNILEKIYDEVAIRIVKNHMTDSRDYIDRIWDFVLALTLSIAAPGTFTLDYQKKARELLEDLINKLVRMAT